jgi:signal transduction histidine kinase
VREAVEDRLYQALGVLRVVLLVNAVGLNLVRADNFDRPTLGIAVVVALVGWTGLASWAYSAAERRGVVLLSADLVVGLTAIGLSLVVKGDDLRATIPGFWVMAPLLAWAVHWGWRGGAIAGLLLSAADLAVRGEFTSVNYSNVFLLLIGGPTVGFVSDSLKSMAAEREVAQRTAAVAAERARLARAVHDGVLQVLALVQRRGGELGGEFDELGKLAGTQEAALRNLIRQQDSVISEGVGSSREPGEGGAGGVADLGAALAGLESLPRPRVHVALPGTPVLISAGVADELRALVEAALANIAQHVGERADAWVLVEHLSDRVIVSVRDAGGGIPEGRLAEAAAEGRLGVAGSIRGRASDLGGSAVLHTGPDGTEWEITVPHSAAAPGAKHSPRPGPGPGPTFEQSR